MLPPASPVCAMAPAEAAFFTSLRVVVSNVTRNVPRVIPFVGSFFIEAGQSIESKGRLGGGSAFTLETKVTTAQNSSKRFMTGLTMRLSDAGSRRLKTKAVYPDHRPLLGLPKTWPAIARTDC